MVSPTLLPESLAQQTRRPHASSDTLPIAVAFCPHPEAALAAP